MDHKALGIELNGRVWELLQKPDRTPEESEEMIHAAHASHYHWSRVGTPVHLQRGHWLLSRVYAVLGRPEPALHHARLCFELTEKHAPADFDLAYGLEAMARALAANRDPGASEWLARARRADESIRNPEDRKIFDVDLAAAPWFDLSQTFSHG